MNINGKTLVLNKSYEPLMILDWRRAFILVCLKKATVEQSYDETVNSSSDTFEIPAVVRLEKMIRKARRIHRFSSKGVFVRDKHMCQYCGVKLTKKEPPTMDHVLPKSRGGPKSWTNIVASCMPCNNRKGDRTPAEAGMTLLSKPRVPTLIKKEKAPLEWRDYLWF